MWWTVLLLALANALTSQPVTNENEKYRQARELGIECCPCPGTQNLDSGLRVPGDQSVDSTSLVDSGLKHALDHGESSFEVIDDCPCKLTRTGDSDGSASVFFPRVLHHLQPVLKPSNSNEEPKPLLKPEVKLASSVLDTLKEVTDEEYQEALARDAARAAASDPDALSDDNGSDNGNKPVNIFINREDGDMLVPQASNVQETRCSQVQPTFKLGRTSNQESLFTPKSIFGRSDTDSGASNINENIKSINKDLQGLQLKTSPSILNLFPGGLKSIINRNKGTNLLKIPKFNLATFNNVDVSNCEKSNGRLAASKVPNLKLGRLSFSDQSSERNLGFKSNSKIPSFRFRLNEDMDSDHSPSNINEHFTEVGSQNNRQNLFKLPLTNLKLRPLRLSNLLNLKDVELIPPSLRKVTKVNIPSLELPPIKPREQIQQEKIVDKDSNIDENESQEVDSEESDVKTAILDVVPSASEHQQITQPITNTKILNSSPNTSEKQHIGNEINSTTEKIFQVTNSKDNNSKTINNSNEDVDDIHEDSIIFDEDSNTIIVIDENGQTTTFGNLDINDQSNDFEEQNIENDYEDSDGIQIDPEPLVVDELPLDSEVDTSNTDFQFALPAETEADFDENITDHQELRSGPNPEEEFTDISNPKEISERLHKIKDHIANRLEEIKFRLAATKTQKDPDLTQNENKNRNNFLMIDNKSNCDCKTERKTSSITIDDLINETSDQFEEIRQEKNSKEVPNLEATENVETSHSENQDLTTEPTKLFEVCCKDNQTSEQGSETEVKANSDEEEATEANSVTEDQEDQFVNTTSISESTTLETTTEPSSSNSANNEEIGMSNVQQNGDEVTAQPEMINKINEEKVCQHINNNNNEKKAQLKTQDNQEMEVGGSVPQPIVAPIPLIPPFRPTLFDNGIVQPSFVNNDIFNTPLPGIGDLFNLDTQLPSLDDVRSGIANALGLNSRNVEESEPRECNLDQGQLKSNLEMSADSSKNHVKSAFPTLRRPLENLNLDIFQVRPLSQSRLPGLDLNSFKTHLNLPSNLGLRPLKLQSSLGRNGGLFGATLTFGPDKVEKSKKTGSTSFRKSNNVLSSSPLVNIPSLNELRDRMRSNAESLLSSSPLTISNIALPYTPTLEALHENLKSHTENTMRNLQHSLASTLNEAKIKQEKYARPKDTLEDLNEKLQALHMDFNDRLTSIHERIFDKSKIPLLRFPRVHESRNEEPVKPIKESNFRINRPQRNKVKEHRNLKPFKISKAASTLTPKSVEVPKLVTTSIKPPVFRPFQRDSSIKNMRQSHTTEPTRTLTLNEQKDNRDNKMKSYSNNEQRGKSNFERTSEKIRNNLKKFEDQRRKLQDSHGFASEVSQNKIPAPTKVVNQNNNFKSPTIFTGLKPKKLEPKTTKTMSEQQKPLVGDSRQGNNLISRKIALLNKSKVKEPQPQSLDDAPSENTPKDVVKTTLLKPKRIHPKPMLTKIPKPTLPALPKTKPLTPIGHQLPSTSLTGLRKDTFVKTTESPFLTRIRESLKTRVKHLNKTPTAKTVFHSPPTNDMSIAATENRGIAVLDTQPLKENVQYRCKMMCVREPAK